MCEQIACSAGRHRPGTRSPAAIYTVCVDHRARLVTLQAALRDLKTDSVVVTHLPNIRYLCGFTGSSAVLVVTRKQRSVFITDGRYTEQAREEVSGARVVIARGPLFEAAAKLVRGVVAVEGEHLTLQLSKALQRLLPARARLKPTSGLIERQRLIKDAAEIAAIRRAVLAGSSLTRCP